jgi:succinate dehydrogenase hydrophobic anchor subunit
MRDQRLWTWHVGAGAIILVLLGLHMTIMHLEKTVGIFIPEGGHALDWGNVAARARSVLFLMTYVALLAAALFHGLYGLRNIVIELNPPPAFKRSIGPVLAVAGVGLFGFGTWAAWASFALARTL